MTTDTAHRFIANTHDARATLRALLLHIADLKRNGDDVPAEMLRARTVLRDACPAMWEDNTTTTRVAVPTTLRRYFGSLCCTLLWNVEREAELARQKDSWNTDYANAQVAMVRAFEGAARRIQN